jgi:hypothetical protein
MEAIIFDHNYDRAAPILPENMQNADFDKYDDYDEDSDDDDDEYDDDDDTAVNVAIGCYLVEGTACVASIELIVNGASDQKPFALPVHLPVSQQLRRHLASAEGHIGNIYARTHTDRQKLDMYSLAIAATVIYTAHFPLSFPNGDERPAKLARLHSAAVVVPSMWVLRPYQWLFPTTEEFDKQAHDTYDAYQQYFDFAGKSVDISLRLHEANVAAAGRVLRDLCIKKKFCHTLPRIDVPKTKAKIAQRRTAAKHDTQDAREQDAQEQDAREQDAQEQDAQEQDAREQDAREQDARDTRFTQLTKADVLWSREQLARELGSDYLSDLDSDSEEMRRDGRGRDSAMMGGKWLSTNQKGTRATGLSQGRRGLSQGRRGLSQGRRGLSQGRRGLSRYLRNRHRHQQSSDRLGSRTNSCTNSSTNFSTRYKQSVCAKSKSRKKFTSQKNPQADKQITTQKEYDRRRRRVVFRRQGSCTTSRRKTSLP